MTEQKQLPAKTGQGVQLSTIEDVKNIAGLLIQSGCFAGADVPKACLKIIAGMEFGFTPFVSMNGFHIIQGKVTMSSNLVAAAIKRSGVYNYKVKKMDTTACTIEFFEKGVSVGSSTFTQAEAQKAGLTGNPSWQKYPRQMCFARTITEGARTYCPDIFGGPVYTPEDFDIATDGNQPVVEVVETETPKENAAATPVKSSETVTAASNAVSSSSDNSDTVSATTQEIADAEEIAFDDGTPTLEQCKAAAVEAATQMGYVKSDIGVIIKAHFGINKANEAEKFPVIIGELLHWFKENPNPTPGQPCKFDAKGMPLKAVTA